MKVLETIKSSPSDHFWFGIPPNKADNGLDTNNLDAFISSIESAIENTQWWLDNANHENPETYPYAEYSGDGNVFEVWTNPNYDGEMSEWVWRPRKQVWERIS